MSPSWPGLHRRLILLISQPKEARTVPSGTGDSKCDFGEAVIGLPVPGKPVSHYHYPLRLPVPLADQHGTGREFISLLVPNWPRGRTLPLLSRSGTFDPAPACFLGRD